MLLDSLTLVEEICCNCSMHFGIDSAFQDRLRTTGGTFHCPAGHAQHYTETEVQKLRKRNQALNSNLVYANQSADRAREEAQQAKRQKAAIKGQLTKTRNRIANGICPCCNRTFTNLARHMGVQHPDFVEVHKS